MSALSSAIVVTTISSATEGLFYTIGNEYIQDTSDVYGFIQESTVKYYSELQTLFTIANSGIVLYYSYECYSLFINHFSVLDFVSDEALLLLGFVATAGLVVGVAHMLFSFVCPKGEPETIQTTSQTYADNETIDIEISQRTTDQDLALDLQTAKLILPLAFACLTNNPIWLPLHVATAAYSLYQNVNTEWLTFKKPLTVMPEPGSTVSYELLVRHAKPTEGEECPICLEELVDKKGDQAPISFCPSHIFHKHCMKETIANAMDHLENFEIGEITEVTTTYNGVPVSTKHEVTVTAEKRHVPSCPMCRETPRQNAIRYKLFSSKFGNMSTSTVIEESSQAS